MTPPGFQGLMAEGSLSDDFQGAKTGSTGGPLPGRWNSRGLAMTFQVWGWRREDASRVLAWVPDAEGGRGAAMPRRTSGEPSAGDLGRPEPSGQPYCGEGGRQGRGSEPGRGAETGPWPCRGSTSRTRLRARAGRGRRVNAPGRGSCGRRAGTCFGAAVTAPFVCLSLRKLRIVIRTVKKNENWLQIMKHQVVSPRPPSKNEGILPRCGFEGMICVQIFHQLAWS